MAFNGNIFTRLQSWVANAASGIKIRADLMDQDTNDIANALTIVMTAVSNAEIALALVTGASLIGYEAAASTAVPRTVLQKLQERFSVKDFGAVGDSSTDDGPAFQLALDYGALVEGISLELPGANYVIKQQLFAHGDNTFLMGVGTRFSTLWIEHNAGTALTVQNSSTPGATFVNNFGMSNISLRAKTFTNQGELLLLNKVLQAYFVNVSLEDHFGGMHVMGGLQHYSVNLNILSPRTAAPVSWTGVQAGSFFYKIERSSDNQIPSEMFIANFNWRDQGFGNFIQHGAIVNCVDGLQLTNGHIRGVDQDDLRVQPINGNEQISGLILSVVWLDNGCTNCLHVLGTTTGSFLEIELNGCKLFNPANTGIFFEDTANCDGLRINGGSIKRAGGFGMLLRGGRKHILSGGLEITCCNTAAAANSGGISADSGPTVPGGPGTVMIGDVFFDDTAQGVTATSMIGVVVSSTLVTTRMSCRGQFNLTAADVSDASTNAQNDYRGSKTSKARTIASVVGNALLVPEIGDLYYLTNTVTNFNNMTARRDGHEFTFIAQAAGVTITASSVMITKSGGNIVTTANGVYRWVYSANASAYLQVA